MHVAWNPFKVQSNETTEAVETSGETKTSVVNVDVYYESLCSDSMRLIANQIIPSYDELKQHLNITFIPYGKASVSNFDLGYSWIFII